MGASAEAGPRLVAVGSGKGGTGKTLAAANVGIFLATLGKRVVVADVAFGSAAVHTFVGIERPRRTLRDVWRADGQAADLSELVTPTPIPGLSLVTGEIEPRMPGGAPPERMQSLLEDLRGLPADYVILDLASGPGLPILDLFLGSDVKIVMMSPDPAAVELGYGFIRAAFARRLEHSGTDLDVDLSNPELRHFAGGAAAPREIYDEVARRHGDELADKVEADMLALRPRVVVNNARSKADMDIGPAIASAGFRRLGLPLTHLGHIEYDDAAWVSLRRRRPLLVEHPESRAAKSLEKLTRRLLARETEKHFASIAVGDNYYDLLEVEPTASEEDIRRANRRARVIYGKESVVVGGLYSAEHLEALHARLDEAYEILMDPTRRRAYDQALFPGGVPPSAGARETKEARGVLAVQNAAPPPDERPPMPEIGPETEFSGALLQQIRESKGIDLRDVADRTKIGLPYLAAIESENVSKLPATVYVRGFLDQYIRVLGLSGERERILETYLPRFERARAEEESIA